MHEPRPIPRLTHDWPQQATGCYVEPPWCSARLFAVESFEGAIHDPCCGTGNIVRAARAAGFLASGADIAPRDGTRPVDFLRDHRPRDNIVMNPPYQGDLPEAFVNHALTLARRKVAFVFPVARSNAAKWLWNGLPIVRVWLLSPRPSMPPIEYILAGKKPEGGRVDFCWVILSPDCDNACQLRRLSREE